MYSLYLQNRKIELKCTQQEAGISAIVAYKGISTIKDQQATLDLASNDYDLEWTIIPNTVCL